MKHLALDYHDNLCFLDLSDNCLASLHGLGHTPQLLQLTLSGNRLTRVTGVTGCPRLQKLSLDSNLLINSKVLAYPMHAVRAKLWVESMYHEISGVL